MKKAISPIIFLLLASFVSFGQILKPTTWSFDTKSGEVKVGETINLEFNATIDKGWYLYSSDFDPDLGPIVTEIKLEPNDSYELVGGLTPIHPKKKYDDIWEGDITYFKEKGQFIQKVKILKPNAKITGSISFQTCTDVDGRCVNGKEKFVFNVKAAAASAVVPVPDERETVAISTSVDEEKEAADEVIARLDTEDAKENEVILEQGTELVNTDKPASETNKEDDASIFTFLLGAFGVGFASIFMPCIFPIMPITVSYFTKQKNGKIKAVFYGFCILLIFSLMGLVTMSLGPTFLNFLSTHWIPNLIFFIIFILFGISLLGAFEIVLPHGAVNKIDAMSDKGGFIGIFFMALTLVLVSFSCTVPLVGTLLILSAEGDVLRPLLGMMAFGLPFALVFGGLAFFPEVLKKLPKSGGWLNELKAVFGLAEFALALKFLSNIDLTRHWELIHRNYFLMFWILISAMITLYILGFLRLPKDSKVEKRSLSRWGFAALFFAFTLYMVPGLSNKPLSLLSGILPPMPVSNIATKLEHPKMKQLPHGLQGFKDYDDALAYSAEVGKPVLIDFTGYACANCRKMEEFVWPKEEVLTRLQNDFVIASLYVDDKAELPKEKHYVSTYDNELKTTVGGKNMDLEITMFNNNAQPYYVIVDSEGKTLMEPLGYSSEEEFVAFLDEGKRKY
ncbi:protein-disulfide reductase DsbD family protein [Arcticibacterium luteifluviistationis]|uniref:Disulfide bond formation protein DsbD n=1 Tax=Arcticibacterium luteifluviistationis TaxID=1784714 RepID=A0A2Z4GH29_9BACT|nr:thioredoxin family protein [Arcticibacterium luteifluviistationis]AWW00114.1 disulfide bond formation protein DsbD [Arcticibacterium luteifluviistationis]